MSKIGLLFPGQGSQYIGMGKALYEDIGSARALMDEAERILGYPIRDIIFNGIEEELRATEIAQPAIFIVSMMYFEKWKQQGDEFSYVAGHSLGEYSALCAAGVLDFESALKLVHQRGMLMAEYCDDGQGMLAVVGLPLSDLSAIIRDHNCRCSVANINSNTQIVVSGEKTSLAEIEDIIRQGGNGSCKWLNVSGAFHTCLMEPANEKLTVEILKRSFQKPVCSFISNLTGTETEDPDRIKQALLKQMVSPVNWLATILRIKELGADVLYEVGPGEVLKKLNATITFKPKCLSLSMNGD